MLLQIIYFLLIGWWVGLLGAAAGYVLCVSIVFLPFGLILLNRLPGLIFLNPPGEACSEGLPHRHRVEELPFLLRALWFILLGWELGFLAISVGYCFCLTIIGLPIGIWILNRVPLLLTLSRRYG